MKVHLQEYFRAFLLRSPFYTSTFLTTQECQAPIIVMRVEELYLFEQKGYRARVGFRTWRNEQQTWIVAVPFCLELSPQLKVEGLLYLNPRRAADYAIVERFATEDYIRFLFLSSDLNDALSAKVHWSGAQREKVRQMVQVMDSAIVGEKLSSVFDPDFEQARQEFQALLSTLELQDGVRYE